MGTSSSFGGLTGGNKLLPTWAQDPVPSSPDQGEEDLEQPAQDNQGDAPSDENRSGDNQPQWVRMDSWRAPKSLMRRYVSSRGDLRRTAKSYVRAKGGARTAARSAVAGKRATARLGGFLSDVARFGFRHAVESLGLRDSIGQPIEAVFATIAQLLAPPGTTLEDHIARRATNDALSAIFDKYGVSETGLEQLDRMDEAAVRDAVKDCVQNYIYQRWLQELGDRIEKHAITAEQAIRLERDVKAYVKEAVKLDLNKVDVLNMDWNSSQTRNTMDSIYADAYSMLEVGE